MRRFAEIDSTNRYLVDEARAGAPEGVVAVADHQTSGRGRLGRSWVAPPGSSLLMSVLLRPFVPPAQLQAPAAAVALAARDACQKVAGVRPALKWPNDLVVDGLGGGERKLAGVLAEVVAVGAAPPAVVVGLGLNLRWPGGVPPGLEGRAAALEEIAAGGAIARDALLQHLLEGIDARASDWGAVTAEYRQECATVGRAVRLQLAAETVTGTAVDLTDEGHLVVDVAGRRRAFVAGDVVHLRVQVSGDHVG